jgi:cation/acetate symporter
MSVQLWTTLFVVLSFGLYIGIAIWSRASSTKEFYVAGGGVPPLANGMATAADWMSAASFISMAGLISFLGRDGTFYLMGWTGGYVLLALLLAPYLRKFGKFTVPDFIGDRYYSQSARLIAVFCAIVISFVYVCGQMQGAGIVFSRFLEVDIETGVIIGMAIVFFYAVLGGMKGITYTQVAQYCVLIFAFTVPAIFISLLMTGQPIPQIGFGSELTEAYGGGYLLDRLDGMSAALGFPTYTEGQRSTQDVFFITAALMFGTAGLPHVIIRFFTVPNVRDARRSAGYALIFIAILYTTAPAVSAFARTNLINTVSNAEYTLMPEWFKKWETTELIRFDDKNGDGRIQYVGDPALNELEVNRDIMVLANPEIADLPDWVVALVVAGALAAALSTAAGLLLVISTSVAHDMMKRSFKPDLTDQQELRLRSLGNLRSGACRRLLRHVPPGLCGTGRRLRIRPSRRIIFPCDRFRHLLEEYEQAGRHCRHGGRVRFHRRVYYLLPLS